MIDRFIFKGEAVSEGQSPPERMPSYPLGMNLVLSTIAGEARGRREILLRVLKPDGTQTDGLRLTMEYGGATDTRHWVVQLRLQVNEPGTYWIEWQCDGRTLMRSPLQIEYAFEGVFLELRLERLACGRRGDRHRSAILGWITTFCRSRIRASRAPLTPQVTHSRSAIRA